MSRERARRHRASPREVHRSCPGVYGLLVPLVPRRLDPRFAKPAEESRQTGGNGARGAHLSTGCGWRGGSAAPRGEGRAGIAAAPRGSPGANRLEHVIPPWYHAHVAMTLRLTREDERILAELAEADGISRQEATVRAIREAAARRGHDRRVCEASARVRARYANVLDRLGR